MRAWVPGAVETLSRFHSGELDRQSLAAELAGLSIPAPAPRRDVRLEPILLIVMLVVLAVLVGWIEWTEPEGIGLNEVARQELLAR